MPSRSLSLPFALLLGGLSGVGIVVAGPPRDNHRLVLVGLVPLLVAAASSRPPAAALVGLTAGTIVQIFGLPWLVPTIARLQGLSEAAALPAASAFVAYHAAPYAGLAALVSWRWRRPCAASMQRCAPELLLAAVVAAAWVVMEWALPRVLPWYLGGLLGPGRWLRQAADLGGVYGLSFVVVLLNALVARAWLVRHQRRTLLAIATAWLAMASGYGAMRAHSDDGRRAMLRLAVVQGDGAPAAGGARPAMPGEDDPLRVNERAWTTYAGSTRDLAGARADLIVWPESALRVLLRDNPTHRRRMQRLTDEIGTPILLGGLDRAATGGELNAAYLLAPGEAAPSVYHKIGLVAFAEYVPPALAWLVPAGWRTTGEFVAGAAPTSLATYAPPLEKGGEGGFVQKIPLDSPSSKEDALEDSSESVESVVRLAPSICYEATLPGWFNAAVRDGAGLLVNLSDDSWFASPAAAAQHLAMTRLRAVETRRWLARASNGGSSAFIDPRGDLIATLPPGEGGTLVRTVGAGGAITPYVRFGDWVVVASAVLVGWSVAVRAKTRET